MNEISLPSAAGLQRSAAMNQLRACNSLTSAFGLVLTEQAMMALCEKREQALLATERVEFGEPALARIIHHFCDSPYIYQEIYEETLAELLDIFYYFKSDSMDMLSDDELLSFMAQEFNGQAHGSLTYLKTTSLENLARNIRRGHSINEEGLDEYDPEQ